MGIEAKRLNDHDTAEWFHKVVGPPWDRKIVRLKIPQDEE